MSERFDGDWDVLAHEVGYTDEKEMLEDLYINEKLAISEIASRLGAGTTTIGRHLYLLSITKRGRGGPNKVGKQAYKLFHLDQRIVLFRDLVLLSKATDISRSLCYKYRRAILRRSDGILRPFASSGVGALQHVVTSPPSPAPNQERAIPTVLQTEEGEG
jgi:hypothetical protein